MQRFGHIEQEFDGLVRIRRARSGPFVSDLIPSEIAGDRVGKSEGSNTLSMAVL